MEQKIYRFSPFFHCYNYIIDSQDQLIVTIKSTWIILVSIVSDIYGTQY